MVLVLFTTLKHGKHWDVLGRIFKIIGPTFKRMNSKFAASMMSYIYELFVTDITNDAAVHEVSEKITTFSNLPEALYAVYVTFQHADPLSYSIEEGKLMTFWKTSFLDGQG